MPLLREFVPGGAQAVKASGRHAWVGEFERKYGLDQKMAG